MAEEKLSKGASFLKKSKWGKIFKENDSPSPDSPDGRQNSFKLNDDVADFLKPSTEKRGMPKLDTGLAKRWPEVHQLQTNIAKSGHGVEKEEDMPSGGKFVFRRPRMRNLTVGFIDTEPDIIGEGGEESEEPTAEISRRRIMIARSASERRVGSIGSVSMQIAQQVVDAPIQHPFRNSGSSQQDDPNFVPRPLRRAQTSHNEFSPALQRKHGTPPVEPAAPGKPVLGRTPTGFSTHNEEYKDSPEIREPPRQLSRARPSINTRFDAAEQNVPQLRQGLTPSSAIISTAPSPRGDKMESPVVRMQREMRSTEGQAFRRASMLKLRDDDDEDDTEQKLQNLSLNKQVPPSQNDSTLSTAALAPTTSRGVSPHDSAMDYEKPTPPSERVNPFADPKYIRQHAPDIPQSQRSEMSNRPPVLGNTDHSRSVQAVAPGHTSNNQEPQQGAPMSMSTVSARQRPLVEQPSYMRAEVRTSSNNTRQPQLPELMPPSSSITQQALSQMTEQSTTTAASNSSIPRRSPHQQADHLQPSASGPAPRNLQPQQSAVFQGPLSPRLQTDRSDYLRPSGQQASPAKYTAYSHQTNSSSIATADRPFIVKRDRSPAVSAQPSPQTPFANPMESIDNDPATEAAYADFAGRVAHMRGVFRLTAEKERPAEKCTTPAWIRAAAWWFLVAKSNLTDALEKRQREPDNEPPPRELLSQGHVDLAKVWWILVEPLQAMDGLAPQSKAAATLKHHLRLLSYSLSQGGLLPPTQSLIQGQNTQIWHSYPSFSRDAVEALGCSDSSDTSPFDYLPFSDDHDSFNYGRYVVVISMHTDDAATDRVPFPCILSLLRGRKEYQTSIAIASQDELVNIKIVPRPDQRSRLTWQNVSWKHNTCSMIVHLAHGYDLEVRMHEKDYRNVWQMTDYSRYVQQSLQDAPGRKFVHSVRLHEVQYAGGTRQHSFPQGKVRGCEALIFEYKEERADTDGVREFHRGYRLVLVTDPATRVLSSVSHDLRTDSPLLYEFLTDSAANGTTAMIITIPDQARDIRILLVFPDAPGRQATYDVLAGLSLMSNERIVSKSTLTSLTIEPAFTLDATSLNSAFQHLQWQRLGVTNLTPADAQRTPLSPTVASASLRIHARHATGCITDRLNLSRGELLLRLPCSVASTIQLLREPQSDMTMSIDHGRAGTPRPIADGLSSTLALVSRSPTARTFTFATLTDLHAFQSAITGYDVLYDGCGITLTIARRRMVVPIYKKWEAINARVQIVSTTGGGASAVSRILAFMEDFSHADALCFRIMGSDDFERVKLGHGKYGIKLVDAKFSLPGGSGGGGGDRSEVGERDREEMVRRRFVNLEGLEYASEHDDITVCFDSEEERDRFAQALPAAASVSRGLTLKRRI